MSAFPCFFCIFVATKKSTMKRPLLFVVAALLLAACGMVKEPLENVRVRMYTTEGVVELRLYDDTPAHRDNFVKLVKEQRYDSLLFHRVIENFMIQGGDPSSKYAAPGSLLGEGDLGYTIDAEIMPDKHFHRRGVLAAAREGDDVNPAMASSSCQFYIVWGRVFTPEELAEYKEIYEMRMGREMVITPEQEAVYTTVGGTPHLDGAYTVFGEVTSGLEVVEKIQKVDCDSNDRPLQDVRILKVEIIK